MYIYIHSHAGGKCGRQFRIDPISTREAIHTTGIHIHSHTHTHTHTHTYTHIHTHTRLWRAGKIEKFQKKKETSHASACPPICVCVCIYKYISTGTCITRGKIATICHPLWLGAEAEGRWWWRRIYSICMRAQRRISSEKSKRVKLTLKDCFLPGGSSFFSICLSLFLYLFICLSLLCVFPSPNIEYILTESYSAVRRRSRTRGKKCKVAAGLTIGYRG